MNEDWILGDDEAEAAWAAKDGHVRLLFAARLIPQKGVAVLLAAIEAASAAGADIEVSIIGTGPLLQECITFAKSDIGKKCVKLMDPVTYGEPFLSLLVASMPHSVPSLSDEQPRILYDAFRRQSLLSAPRPAEFARLWNRELTGDCRRRTTSPP